MPMRRWLVITALVTGVVPGSGSQSPEQQPRITGISHIAFRVSDVQASRRFYGELLGLDERAPAGGSRLQYAVGHRQAVVLESGLDADADERLSHIAYETPDVNALAAYLKARGIPVHQPADRCQDASVRVTDPDGHSLEFVERSWPSGPATPKPARALSNRILHAGVIVADEQLAHRFYRDTLGFGEIWRGGRNQGITQWVNMRVPDGTDYLEYMLTTASPDRRQRGVLHHLCLLVPDIQAAWEEVGRRTTSANGLRPAPPAVGVNGRWQLNLYDPDGTRAELMEPFTIR
jgi:lactoylglutathione lyase